MSVKSYYQASLAGNMGLDSRFDSMLTGPDDYIREEYRINTGPPAFAARTSRKLSSSQHPFPYTISLPSPIVVLPFLPSFLIWRIGYLF
jgi:hypothetical protein